MYLEPALQLHTTYAQRDSRSLNGHIVMLLRRSIAHSSYPCLRSEHNPI